MDRETDSLPNRPLPFEHLTKLTTVHSLCLVNHSAPDACPNVMWKGREGEYPDRNLHLSTPDSAFFDFSKPGFISRLMLLAQSFSCHSHRENTGFHAYFAYLWVAYRIIKLGPSHKWDKTQLHWFALRADTEMLVQGQRPPFWNFDREVCYLDSLERCADYLPASEKKEFLIALRNMVVQGKSMTVLDEKQVIKVDELLGRLEICEEPAKVDRFLESLPHDEEREQLTDVESETGGSELEDTLIVDEVIKLPTEYPQEDRKQDFAEWMRNTVPPGTAIARIDNKHLLKVDELLEESQQGEEPLPHTDIEAKADEPKLGETPNVDELSEKPTGHLSEGEKQNFGDEMRTIIPEEKHRNRLGHEQSAKVDDLTGEIKRDERSISSADADSEADEPKPWDSINVNEIMRMPTECLPDDSNQTLEIQMETQILEEKNMTRLESEPLVKVDERLVKPEEAVVNNKKQPLTFDEQLTDFEARLMRHEEQLLKFKKLLMETEERSLKAEERLRELQRDEDSKAPIHPEIEIVESSNQASINGDREPNIGLAPETDMSLHHLQHPKDQDPIPDIEPVDPRLETHESVADESEADEYVAIGSSSSQSLVNSPETNESEVDEPEMDDDGFGADESEADDSSEAVESEVDEPETNPSLLPPTIHTNPFTIPFTLPWYRYPWYRGSAV
ncbi:MAG: hypothetical protein HETSPECPRED_008567 [Heterodermia speciosa]|uniref:Uncharacterized protein n=1 Tax=Heterodermia speciosa TaxID=116794 RepID=A0A8H3FZX4_9LECA|nr:MAG: hypothetical protein HETSPECPRED_008567 [Heterodermia speciosa]